MKRKIIWLVLSCLVVLVLVATACAPAPKEEAPAAPAAPAAPVAPAAPAVKEAAPAVKEAAPVEAREMSTVTLTKRDGTPVVKTFEKPKYGGEIKLFFPGPSFTWDELTTAPWSVSPYMDMTHEMLLAGDWTRGPAGTEEVSWQLRGWFDPRYERGLLAESWEFPDNETIIFHLRKGVRWHNRPPVNGREFVADDVVYALKRIYTTPTATMYGMAGEGRPLDITATDKYTVVVKVRPGFTIATLDYMTGWTRIFAPEVEKQYGSQNVDVKGVGTGPYIITDYVPASSHSYIRNPDYWDYDQMLGKDYRLPYIDKVKLLVIPDRSTQISALATGKIDVTPFAYTRTWEEAAILEKIAPHLKSVKYSVNGRYWIGGRLDRNLPFNDIRVRRAMMMAINHQEIVDALYGGYATILSCPVVHTPELVRAYTPLEKLPPSADGFDNKKLYTGPHIAEAKKLLAEAGYPDGFTTKVNWTAGAISYALCSDDAFQTLKEYWAKIGINLVLEPLTSAVRESMYQRKTFDEMFLQTMATAFPQHMYTHRVGNIYNTAMVNDPKIAKLYERINDFRAWIDDGWWEVLTEFNLYAIDRVYYCTIPAGYEWAFWQPWLKRYAGEHTIGPYQPYHQWLVHAWIDQELKKSMGY